MEDQAVSWLKGQFLIAMPGLADPNFHQTVTCISEHTTAGAVGIVINRVHESLTAKAIFQELKMEHGPATESIPVHIGGPVNMDEVFILHGQPFGGRAACGLPTLWPSAIRSISWRPSHKTRGLPIF